LSCTTEGDHLKPVAILGLLLIVVGVAALAYQGFTYTSRETVLNVGPIHATADRDETVTLPPVLGGWSPAALSCSSRAFARPRSRSGRYLALLNLPGPRGTGQPHLD
jgi:hypothetical protein